MRRNDRTAQQGMALVVALMFIAIALLVLGSLSTRLMSQRLVVRQFEIYNGCFNGLESAFASSRVALEQGEKGAIGIVDTWVPVFDANNDLVLPAFDSVDYVSTTSPHMPEVEYMSYVVDWFGDGRDSNGDGDIDDIDEQFMYTIYVKAKHGKTVRQAETVYEGTDINVWRNAIFAGKGQIGGVIAGNSSIHGSVHILGEHLPPGGVAMAALDLTGSSLVHNNYAGLAATLLSRIPALPTVSFQGQEVGSLSAKLRVKRGLVGMSGNSEIGEVNNTANAIKETMDGTFVADGWTGNSVTDDGDRGDPSQVRSDNGWDELYDIGDKVSLPTLADEWRDTDGGTVLNPTSGIPYTQEQFFSQVLLANPTSPTDGVYTGNITLDTSGNSFYWNATKNQMLSGSAANSAVPAAGDDYMKFNTSTDVLEVNGQLRINGNLATVPQGSQSTIHYSGRAALLVTGTVTIDTSLLTCNNGVPADTANSFPANNALGIMTPKKMVVGSTSQLSIMGAFFSETEIQTMKQTNVLGSFVSAYFNMGTNVPHIYQVPALAENLPYGMIGNYPIFSLTAVSWRELGVE